MSLVVLLAALTAEPEFAGRPLSVWAKQLKEDDTPRRRGAAAQALGQIGTRYPESLTAVLPALGTAAKQDGSPQVRRQAVASIAQQKPDDSAAAVPDLAACLRAEMDGAVRLELANALGRFGPNAAPAVAPLTDCLPDPDAKLRAAAASALGRVGPEASAAASALLARLTDPDPTVKREAVAAVSRVKPAEPAVVAAALVKLLPPAEPALKRDVLESLGRLADPTADTVTAVAGELADADAEVRATAAQTLGRFGPASRPADNRLAKAFTSDAAVKVREACARTLAVVWQSESSRVVGRLADRLTADSAVEVRVAIADLLGGFGPAAQVTVPALRRARGDSDPRVRLAATEALRRVESKP